MNERQLRYNDLYVVNCSTHIQGLLGAYLIVPELRHFMEEYSLDDMFCNEFFSFLLINSLPDTF